MPIIIPDKRILTRQPQGVFDVDRSSKLLGNKTNIIVGSNSAIDVGSKKPFSTRTTDTKIGAYGLDYYGTPSQTIATPNVSDGTLPITMAAIFNGYVSSSAGPVYYIGQRWSGGLVAQVDCWDTTISGFRTLYTSVSDNVYNFVVVTINESRLISFYVNGSLVGSVTAGNTQSDSAPESVILFDTSTVYGRCPLLVKTNRAWTESQVRAWQANPWQIFSKPKAIVYGFSASSGVTGTLAKTNTNDSITASGTTTVIGTLAKTVGNDTCSASGNIGSAVSGTLAKTNANDTISASGKTTIVGSISKTNVNDSISASGTTAILGTLSRTNTNDLLSASGSVGSAISGTLNRTNADDSISALGKTTIVGALARTNNNDAPSISGTTNILGTLAKSLNNDTANGSGTITVSGSLNRTNSNDSISASGSVGNAIIGSLSKTNNNDSVSATGTTTVTGLLTKSNNNDSVSASGYTAIIGSINYGNVYDVIAASGTTTIKGTLLFTNHNDTGTTLPSVFSTERRYQIAAEQRNYSVQLEDRGYTL